MTDGGGDEGTPDEENTKPNINDKEHTTFLDVINGTGEISLKDDKIQAALPPKPKIEQLYTPYAQMYVYNLENTDDKLYLGHIYWWMSEIPMTMINAIL